MELQRPVLQLWLMIGLWWSGYFVVNLGLMWDFAYQSAALLWWVEMTAIQNILGSVASILVAKLTGRSVWPTETHRKKVIVIAALGHLLGNLAINAAYSLNESGIALILITCQPLFTFVLTTRSISLLHFSQFSSVAVLLGGLVTFRMECSALFNAWGVAAAATSSLAFTGRNVLLKEGFNNWDNTLEKYVAVSSLSAVFSLPLWILKVTITGTMHTITLGGTGALLYIVYPIQSFTSFKVLEMVTPVTHAIVSIFARLYSSVDSLTPLDFPWSSFMGIFAFLVGVYLYYFQNQSTNKVWMAVKFILLFSIAFSLVKKFDVKYEKVDLLSKSIDHLSLRMLNDTKGISTAWLYDRPITENIVANIGNLADNNPTMKVYVYCGTTQCVREVAALEKENVVVGFAVMSDIVKGTPLENWVAHHPINKLLAGQEFESHLHEVAILGILWRYGGYYVNPMVTTAYESLSKYHNGTWAVVSRQKAVPKGSLPSALDVLFFSKHHPMLKRLAEVYVIKYPTINDDNPFKFDFMNAVWRRVLDESIDSHCFNELSDSVTHLDDSTGPLHYGILSHSAPAPSQLIDDAIENFAALQYLPFVDSHLNRENVQSVGKGNVTVFFNGKWTIPDGERFMATLEYLRPIMLSFHFNRTAPWSKEAWWDFQSYLQKHEPIGCRDEDQAKSLLAKGVKAFSPSSLMLLLRNPSPGVPKNVYITDVEQEFMDLFLSNIPKKVIVLHYKQHHNGSEGNELATSKAAYLLMKRFQSAKLVITQNFLHAIACAAMETPVIYVIRKPRAAETLGLLFHTINAYKMTKYQIKEWLGNFSWTNIPHNPNPAQLMRLRATSWNVIRRDQHLHDSAVKLGVVPMSPPVSLQHERKLTFYLVFSTSSQDSLHLLDSSSKVSGIFNWRHWRTVESIFYHHPTAEVKVYSNTLPDDTFSVLTEAGYSIEICRYKLESMLICTPAEGFIGKLESARLGPFWYANVADLLRLLLLYQHGGIYIDTDIIVVRPLNSLPVNIAGVQDRQSTAHGSVNSAFLYFQKGNQFLEACLKEFAGHYDGKRWGQTGPSLITRVYHASTWSEDAVHIVDYKKFYMYPWREVKKCFTDVKGDSFDMQMKILETEAYVVHLNSKITGAKGVKGNSLKNGTVCKHLLNSYCVLCDEIH